MEVRKLGPDFFLTSNTDEYYTWYKPAARRGKLILNAEGVVHQEDPIVLPDGSLDSGSRTVLLKELAPPDIVGITITGYLLTPHQHMVRGGKTIFVVDTLYEMRDPFTDEEMQFEYDRVTSLRDYIASFTAHFGSIQLIAQNLQGITLNGTVWGDRIDAIWNNRARLDYPIDGLVFYSRNANRVYIWTDVRTVTCQDGTRVAVKDMNLDLLPKVVDRYTMTWEDLAGVGPTVLLWILDQLSLVINVTLLRQTLVSLDEKTKDYINSVVLLSPRQRALFVPLAELEFQGDSM